MKFQISLLVSCVPYDDVVLFTSRQSVTLHQENMSMKNYTHVYLTFIHVQLNWGIQGFTYFSYFDPKHRLWVHVKTASPRRF